MDRFYPGISRVPCRRRSFHRLGIGVAGAIIALALAFVGAAFNRLDLFETLSAEILVIVAGFALILLGVVATGLPSWGLSFVCDVASVRQR
jgi:hypothetical protein